jgi:hypothetical protein
VARKKCDVDLRIVLHKDLNNADTILILESWDYILFLELSDANLVMIYTVKTVCKKNILHE